MIFVIVRRDHQQVDIRRFFNENDALEFIEQVETDPDVRCELVYEEESTLN